MLRPCQVVASMCLETEIHATWKCLEPSLRHEMAPAYASL